MKSDKTFPPSSTSITASERPFSNQHPLPQIKPPQSLPIKKSKIKNDASLKSLIEDKTSTSESTAHGAAQIEIAPAPTPTPRRYEPKVAATMTSKQIRSKPAPKPKPTPSDVAPGAPAASSPQIRTPVAFFDGDSTLSPTTLTEHDQQQQSHPHFQSSAESGEGSNEEKLLKKFKENIYQIQEVQSKEFSWIRKLSSQKWIMFFDTVLAGFTLLFFSTAFYLIFHINPTLEYKLTPEFQLKIQPFTVAESFQRCNHTSWIRTDNSLAPVIQYHQCYKMHEYGRIFLEIFKSSTPNSSDVCNIDRIEFHQCYTKEDTNDSMNVFFGFKKNNYDNYICNGSSNSKFKVHSIFSFNPPVQKYSMFEEIGLSKFINQTISSATFFFRCPKCATKYRIKKLKHHKNEFNYQMVTIATSIPTKSRKCYDSFGTGDIKKCKLDDSRFITDSQKSFSRQVFPFVIIEDRKNFCGFEKHKHH